VGQQDEPELIERRLALPSFDIYGNPTWRFLRWMVEPLRDED
jgi:hypothetical protein